MLDSADYADHFPKERNNPHNLRFPIKLFTEDHNHSPVDIIKSALSAGAYARRHEHLLFKNKILPCLKTE